jgi:hypothetical protein
MDAARVQSNERSNKPDAACLGCGRLTVFMTLMHPCRRPDVTAKTAKMKAADLRVRFEEK